MAGDDSRYFCCCGNNSGQDVAEMCETGYFDHAGTAVVASRLLRSSVLEVAIRHLSEPPQDTSSGDVRYTLHWAISADTCSLGAVYETCLQQRVSGVIQRCLQGEFWAR